MHDPMVVAFEIPAPWLRRYTLGPDRRDPRWGIRVYRRNNRPYPRHDLARRTGRPRLRRWCQVIKLRSVAVACLVVAATAGCADPLGDRGGQQGTQPDKISDVDYVEVFRNVDNYPNIALVCIDGTAFATPSTGRGESAGATPIIRWTEKDPVCADLPTRPDPAGEQHG